MIRRLYAQDADFKAICGDYEDALNALRHWEATRSAADAKVLEYRSFMAELEAEILQILERARKR